MLPYLTKRALSSLIALFIFATVMFFVTEIMIPGDFTTQFSEMLSPEERAALQHELGLDLPLTTRYLAWLGKLLQGTLGTSLYGPPVLDILKRVLPYTLLVFFLGTLIAFQLGQWLGRVVTWPASSKDTILMTARKFFTGGATLGAVMLYTAFPPWLAFLVTTIFSRRLHLVRDSYRNRTNFNEFVHGIWVDTDLTPSAVMWGIVVCFVVVWLLLRWLWQLIEYKAHWRVPVWLQVPAFVGVLVGSWYVLGFGPWALDVMKTAGVPLATYVLLSFGETLLIMRTSLTDTLKEDYITTARAKGLSESAVRDQHAARTALLPVLSRFVVSLPYMLSGVVIVEDVLGWPGISNTLFDSLYHQDMPMVMGALLFIGVLSAFARLVLDVVYALLDPRIRYGRGQMIRET